jgi:5-bromo-4-chloroindolyl phosphate hydrolysis protein
MRSGGNHLIASMLAAVALPLGVFGLNLPLLIVVPIAVVLYAGVALTLAPRSTAERVNVGEVGRAQADLVASLIEEGEATVGRLREAARTLRTGAARKAVAHLAETAQGILDRLAAEPDKLSAVRRFLTYYLPRSAEIAEGLSVVEKQRNVDPGRQGQIEAILGKLDQAFVFYADSLSQAELDTLDVELKLMSRALSEDLGGTAPDPVPTQRKGF